MVFKLNTKYLLFLFILNFSSKTFSCTGISIKTNDNSNIHARTLEFDRDLNSQILFVPRNYKFTAIAPNGKPEGLEWPSKYAVLGANALKAPVYVDGVNEKGLAGGLFYFQEFAQYQKATPEEYKKSIPMWQLLTWILTSFSSVEEVKKALPNVIVSDAVFKEFGNQAPPAHLKLSDTAGNQLVVEYRDNGKLFMYDNPIGVITNSPNFDWHLTNIRNYLNLSPVNPAPKTFNGITFKSIGMASGLQGLPGDFTSPSRYIRAVLFTQAAPKVDTAKDGISQAFHILNNFDIPKGVYLSTAGQMEYTEWTSAADMNNKVYYIRPYDNFQIQKIELDKMDLNAKELKTFSIQRPDEFIEIK